MIKVSPSILSADFARLLEDINKVNNADMLHVDVMDGHFVPNISIGIPVVSSIKKSTNIMLDVHLMISDPMFYADAFIEAGADLICFHIESDSNPLALIKKIKSHGVKVGVAIKPATTVDAIEDLIEQVDMVLVMTVEPGFGGQAFQEDMLTKIMQVSKIAQAKNLNIDIQVDGGINLATAQQCINAGANVLVAGSFVFNSNNPSQCVAQLQAIKQQ